MRMMNSRKYISISIIVIVLLFLFYIVWERHLSSDAIKGKSNLAKSSLIKKGMSEQEVRSILGEPTQISPNMVQSRSGVVFKYPSSNIDYVEIEIIFDSAGYVTTIFAPAD